MGLIISLASFVLSVVIIYYVVRKATRADEIVDLLLFIAKEKKAVDLGMELFKEEKEEKPAKSDADYLREARVKAGL